MACARVRVVCCPDSLKGVLSAQEAAAALADGSARVARLRAGTSFRSATAAKGTAEAL